MCYYLISPEIYEIIRYKELSCERKLLDIGIIQEFQTKRNLPVSTQVKSITNV
jgi:hypothetical protein